MSSAIRIQFLGVLFFLFSAPSIFSQQIEFDVPAIGRATEISGRSYSNEKTIEITLPISTASNSEYRGNLDEFRFDVSWNRSVYAIEDFAPKTETVSKIEGLVNVERDSSSNAAISLNLNSKPFELSSANIASDIGSGNAKRERYQEIPQHDVLVASGTIDRGTGAFFRFHPSRISSLEGSRDLKLTYRVPLDWQSGILKVECKAIGRRSVAGLWTEPFEIGRSFVVPVYLEENTSAQKLAIDFAKSEQDLRKAWLGFEQKMKQANPFVRVIKLRSSNIGQLPEKWPHLLIQSGDDRYLSEFEGYLTQEVAVAAGKFVQARSSLDQN